MPLPLSARRIIFHQGIMRVLSELAVDREESKPLGGSFLRNSALAPQQPRTEREPYLMMN